MALEDLMHDGLRQRRDSQGRGQAFRRGTSVKSRSGGSTVCATAQSLAKCKQAKNAQLLSAQTSQKRTGQSLLGLSASLKLLASRAFEFAS